MRPHPGARQLHFQASKLRTGDTRTHGPERPSQHCCNSLRPEHPKCLAGRYSVVSSHGGRPQSAATALRVLRADLTNSVNEKGGCTELTRCSSTDTNFPACTTDQHTVRDASRMGQRHGGQRGTLGNPGQLSRRGHGVQARAQSHPHRCRDVPRPTPALPSGLAGCGCGRARVCPTPFCLRPVMSFSQRVL